MGAMTRTARVKSRTWGLVPCRPPAWGRANLVPRVHHASIRTFFVCSAALLAAVGGDAVLEWISNAGILWHGHYTDRSSMNLLPVFLLAALAIITALGLLVHKQTREEGISARSFFLSSSRSFTRHEVVRLLPTIFLLQILVLFSMETAEQIAVYGHVFGGTLWMGAPILASLFGHAIFAVLSALSLSNSLEALAKALVCIVKRILTLLAAFADACRTPTLRHERICVVQLLASAVVGERGPPLSIAL